MRNLLEDVPYEDADVGPSVAVLIATGENERTEFKSGMRWNTRTQQVDNRMENGVLKTITACLSSGAGTLLVGVSDDGRVVGLGLEASPTATSMRQQFGANGRC